MAAAAEALISTLGQLEDLVDGAAAVVPLLGRVVEVLDAQALGATVETRGVAQQAHVAQRRVLKDAEAEVEVVVEALGVELDVLEVDRLVDVGARGAGPDVVEEGPRGEPVGLVDELLGGGGGGPLRHRGARRAE